MLVVRKTHGLKEQGTTRQRSQIAYREEWILKVIKQAETDYKVEVAKLTDLWVLDVSNLEADAWKTVATFLHVADATIKGGHF
jgi:hypothetical protein